jgi:hypothetical protein
MTGGLSSRATSRDSERDDNRTRLRTGSSVRMDPEIVIDRVGGGAEGVYIGRAVPEQNLARSPLGSPYYVVDESEIADESERARAIADYEGWLRGRLHAFFSAERTEINRLMRILQRDGRLVLRCWCRDAGQSEPACHGDVIAAVIRERLAKDKPAG